MAVALAVVVGGVVVALAAITAGTAQAPAITNANSAASYVATFSSARNDAVGNVVFRFPANTDVSGATVSVLRGNATFTAGTLVINTAARTVTVPINYGGAAASNWTVTLSNIVNPSQPYASYTYSAEFGGSSLTTVTATSPTYQITAATTSLAAVTALATPDTLGSLASYDVTLTLGANGRISGDTLAAAGANQIRITFPTGVSLSGVSTSNVRLNSSTVPAAVSVSGQTVTITLPSGATYAGGSNVLVSFLAGAGLTNPGTAGTYSVQASTTAETTSIGTNNLTISAAKTVEVTSSAQPAGTVVTRGALVPVDGFTMRQSLGSGTSAVSGVTITGSTNVASNVSGVVIYRDTDSNPSNGLGTALNSAVAFSGQTAAITFDSAESLGSSAVQYWVVYTMSGTTQTGQTVRSTVTDIATSSIKSITTAAGGIFTVDADAPTIVSASPVNATTVDVVFSEALDPATVLPANFTVSNGLTVTSALLQADNRTVRLTTGVQVPEDSYTVTAVVGTIKDVAGNAISASNTASFTGWGSSVITIASANQPTAAYLLRGATKTVDGFSMQLTAGSGTRNVTSVTVRDSGTTPLSTVSGVIVYRDTDTDASNGLGTRLNTTAATFSGTDAVVTFDAAEAVGATSNQYWVVYQFAAGAADAATARSQIVAAAYGSGALALTASGGNAYTIDAAAPTVDTTFPSTGTTVSGMSVTVTGTATDSGSGVASVLVAIQRSSDNYYWNGSGAGSWQSGIYWNASTFAGTWSYLWNFSPAGQDGTPTYSITAMASDQLGNSYTDATPVTNVRIDNVGPTVVSASAVDLTHVDVVFSEALASASVQAGDFTVGGLTVSDATLQADGKTVRLTTTAAAPGQSYTVTCTSGSLTDVAGNASITPNTATFVGYGKALALASGTQPSGTTVNPNQTFAVDSFTLQRTSGSSAVSVTAVTVRDTGTTPPSTVSGVRIYLDNGDGSYGSGDTLLNATPAGFASTDATVTFDTPQSVASATKTYWVVYTVAAGAIDGSTARNTVVSLTSDADAVANTVSQGNSFTIAVSAGATLTVAQGSDAGRPTGETAVGPSSVKAVDELALSANGGAARVSQVVVRGNDSADSLTTDVTKVQLFVDDGSGSFDGADTQLGSDATFSGAASGSTATFASLAYDIASGVTKKVWIVYTFGASPGNGHEVGSTVANGDVSASVGTVNAHASIVSANSAKTYAIDSAGPSVVSAVAQSSASVDVVFSEALLASSIQSSDFTVSGLTVSAASLQADGKTVRLTTTAQTSGQSYTVTAVLGSVADVFANASISPNTKTFTGYTVSDSQAPSVPSNVSATAGETGTVAVVSWTASTDNIGVAGYRIYRATTSSGPYTWIGNSANSPFNDVTGSSHTDYWYQVSAYDAAGNESSQSAFVGPINATWSTPSPHASYGQGALCSLCHVPHNAATSKNIFRDTGGSPGEMSVCYQCHDGTGASDAKSEFALTSGHTLENQATGGDLTNTCSSCHGPHHPDETRPSLWRDPINSHTVTGANNTWCESCHDNSNSWYTGTYPSTPTHDATGYPVLGTFPGASVYNDPTKNAHANIPTETVGQSKGACLRCHAAHRSNSAYDSLLATFTAPTAATVMSDRTSGTFAASCFACHGGQSSWVASGAADIKRYVTRDGATDGISSGHRIKTAGGTLPVGSPLPCYDCHNPHGSTSGNPYLISDERWTGVGDTSATASASRSFCLGCHVTSDGKDGAGNTLAASDSARLVEGLPRVPSAKPANSLKIAAGVPEHSSGSSVACFQCHGRDYSSASGFNVHAPSAGVSGGGVACYSCHSDYKDPMEDDVAPSVGATRGSYYHHSLGGSPVVLGGYRDGDYAPGAGGTYVNGSGGGSYMFCTSCHLDHDQFNSARGSNLRRSALGTVSANYDYDTATGTGVCYSCHSGSSYPKGSLQKSDGTTNTAVADYADALTTPAHDYAVESSFGPAPSDVFRGNCVKCHTDEAPKSFQSSGVKFGVHYSANSRLLSAFGAAPVEKADQAFCFSCHTAAPGKSVAGRDAYGMAGASMAATMEAAAKVFSLGGSSHPVTATANGSVECVNCHNPHTVASDGKISDPANTYNPWTFDTPNLEVQFCQKCHSSAALPTYKVDGSTNVPATVTISAADRSRMDKSAYPTLNHWTVGGAISSGSDCSACHDKHGSRWPYLLGQYNSAADTNTINGQAITGADNSVCKACHASAGDGYAPATPTLTSIDKLESARDAAGYFSPAPSAGTTTTVRWPGWTAWTTLSTSAHFNTAKSYNGKAVNACAQCHDVHGTANAYDELTATYSDANFTLCLQCHNGVTSTPNLSRYYKAAAGGTDGSAPNAGHSIQTAVPGSKLAVGDAIPCYDCHNPHGSKNGNAHLISDQRWSGVGDTLSDATSSRTFCLGCHVTSDGKDGAGNTLTASNTANLFEGMPRRPVDTATYGSALQLPALTGTNPHGSSSTQACFDCHGKDYSTATSNNVHNPSGGVSGGGTSCYSCHSGYRASMEDTAGTQQGDATRKSYYHHVLGGTAGDGDYAPAAGSYSASTDDVYCTSCHGDHDKFNANKGANLRAGIADASGATTNTDFVPSGTYGICASCHATSRAKDTVNQKWTSGDETRAPKVAGADYAASAHDYSVSTTFGSSPFNANCSKCHDDEQTTSFQSRDPSGFATHYSAEKHILAAMGVATAADEAQEALCFKCHTTANSGKDGYGIASLGATAAATYAQFQLTGSKHPVSATTSGSVECQSCHNVHVNSATSKVASPTNTYVAASWSAFSDKVSFCLACHSSASLPTTRTSDTTYVPSTVAIASGDAAQMNKQTYAARAHWANNGSISAAEQKGCVDCHDNHASNAPKLLGAYDVASGTNKVNGTAVTTNDKAVCFACHTSASSSYPTQVRDAAGYPTDGTFPGAAVWNTAYSAANHSGSFHSTSKVSWPGSGATAGDCKNCHDVHGAANSYDELLGTFTTSDYTLCFNAACHGSATNSVNIRQYYPTTNGGTQTQTAATRYGHKIEASSTLSAGSGVPCYDCHDPHGSASAFGLTIVVQTSSTTTAVIGDASGELTLTAAPTDTAAVRRFCFSCHTTGDASLTKGWDGSAMSTVTAGAKFEGIDRTVYDAANKRGMKLPPVSGHYLADTTSCYTCHGNDYVLAGGFNVHNPSGGISTGSQSCYSCHAGYRASMEDTAGTQQGDATRKSYYHHVLGGTAGDGDYAPAAGSYSASTDDVYCTSCHGDHDKFNANKGANLRAGIADASGATTNTDFVPSGTYGICASCHATSRAKDTVNQKWTSGDETRAPKVAGADYDASAHDYSITTTFTNDATPFNANCSKCHDDEQATSYQSRSFGTHYSAEKHILAALGVTVTNDEAQENLCFKCHTTANSGKDGYGIASLGATAAATYAQFQLTGSKHPVSATTSGSVECQSCHNVHVNSAASKVASPTNTYVAASWSAFSDKVSFCLACHSSASLPTTRTSDTTYVPSTVAIASGDAAQMNKQTNGARAHWSAYGSISAPEQKGCVDCHDNHASNAPKLLGAYDVASGTNKVNGVTVTTNDKALCFACHATYSSSYPTATRDAAGYPTDGTFPGPGVWNTAYSAANHTGSFHSTSKVSWPGAGATAGDCKNCHDVHGAANSYDELLDTFTTSDYTLCFNAACHGSATNSVNIRQYYPTTNGGTQTQAAATRYGHKIEASSTLSAGSGIPCYDCHNPHGTTSAFGLLVVVQTSSTTTAVIGDGANELTLTASPSDPAAVRRFCFTCHTTGDTTPVLTKGWDGSNMVTITAGAKFEGIDRTVYDSANKRGMKLPPVSGHYLADATNCYTCHGNDYSTAGGYNVHNPTGGTPNGGSSCYSCHPYTQMGSGQTGYYHHVLSATNPDQGPGSGTYPSVQSGGLYCVSCHTDHNYFNSNQGANLRTGYNAASGVETNTDYVPTGGGLCLSCHSIQLTRNTSGQAAGTSPTVPAVDGAAYQLSAHNFNVQGLFGSSVFNANCSKCHDDETTGSRFTSTNKFGLHYSAESRLLAAMGVTLSGSSSYPNLCYKCHSTSDNPNAASFKDYYGSANMTSTSLQVKTDAAKVRRHPVETFGNHVEGEGTAAGWNAGTSRHANCYDCHDVHQARSGVTTAPSSASVRTTGTVPPIGGALTGVWGVTITGANSDGTWAGAGTTLTPTQPSYTRVTSVSYQWQLCLKCHSTYSWGSNATPTVSLDTANTTGKQQTDIGKDFNPSLSAYHPIFKQGLNQPAPGLNANWNSSAGRRLVNGVSSGWGLSNTFTDGWLSTSIVVCTDCHGSDSASGSNGPHGSTLNWILKGKDTGIKVTIAGGTVTTPNSTLGTAGNFCVNCHRSDVYSASATYANLSRATHSAMCAYPDVTNNSKGTLYAYVNLASCFHCHGARQNSGQPASGALHGTNYKKISGTEDMGYRFLNGASWQGHSYEDVSGGAASNCWTLSTADSYSNCTQHSSARGGMGINYYYSNRR